MNVYRFDFDVNESHKKTSDTNENQEYLNESHEGLYQLVKIHVSPQQWYSAFVEDLTQKHSSINILLLQDIWIF